MAKPNLRAHISRHYDTKLRAWHWVATPRTVDTRMGVLKTNWWDLRRAQAFAHKKNQPE